MKKRRMILFLPGLLLFIPPLHAQVDTLWTRTFGGDGWDHGECVRQTDDGGFIVVGGVGADVDHQADIYLVKTDDTGQTEWTREIGRSRTQGSDYGESVEQTEDGGYIISGHTFLPGEGTSWEVYLVKTDASGDTVWTRTFGGPESEDGTAVQQTTDGGYIITGWTSSYGAGGLDVLLIKTDASGRFVWRKAFGGPYDDGGQSVRQTADGGYIVVGYARHSEGGYSDVYLVKTDASGSAEWEKTIGGDREDAGFSVLQRPDGGYVVAGRTGSFGAGGDDIYLIATGAAGDTLWTRTFGGYGDDRGYSLAQTRTGGYVIAGNTNSFGPGDNDIYLVGTDETGTALWTWVFGGSLDETGLSVQETSDGGYVLAGDIGSFAGEFWDIYLVRASQGIVSIEGDEGTGASLPGSGFSLLRQNCPNPFNPVTVIRYEIADPGAAEAPLPVDLDIYDIRGRLIRTLVNERGEPGTFQVQWDGRDESGREVPSGVYLYRLRVGAFRTTRKMILEK